MRILNSQQLERFCRKHADAQDWLESWLAVAGKATWRSLQELRETYSHADGVRLKSGSVVTVFNVCGNRYRLLTLISYRAQVVDVIDVVTHAEYSKDRWKNAL